MWRLSNDFKNSMHKYQFYMIYFTDDLPIKKYYIGMTSQSNIHFRYAQHIITAIENKTCNKYNKLHNKIKSILNDKNKCIFDVMQIDLINCYNMIYDDASKYEKGLMWKYRWFFNDCGYNSISKYEKHFWF